MTRRINKEIKNIFLKKFLFFRVQSLITLVIIFIIILSAILYSNNLRNIIIKNFSESNRLILEEISISVDLIIDNILDISKQIYKDNIIEKLMDLEDLEGYDVRSTLLNKVHQIKYSNQHIYSAYLYLEKSGTVVSTDYGINTLEEFKNKDFLDWYNKDRRNIVFVNTHSINSYEDSSDNKNVFSVYSRIPLDAIDSYKGALIINIEQMDLYNNIIEKLNSNKDTQYFLLDENKRIIMAKDDDKLKKSIYDTEFSFNNKIDSNEGNFVANINGKPYLAVYCFIAKRNWIFISFTPFSEVYNTIRSIEKLVAATAVLIVVLSILITVLFNLKTFKPIEELVDLLKLKGRCPKKPSNQINYLQEAVTDILQTNEEIQEKLRLTIPVYKEKFLYRLIKEDSIKIEEIDLKLKAFNIDIPQSNLVLSILKINEYTEIISNNIYDETVLKIKITSILDVFFNQKRIYGFTCETSQDEITFVVKKSWQNTKEILELLSELQNVISEKINISATITVCDFESDISKLNECYRKAKKLLKYKILYGKNEILLCSDFKHNNSCDYNFSFKKGEILLNYIKAGHRDEAIYELKSIMQDVYKNKSFLHVQQFLIHLHNSILTSLLKKEVIIPLDSLLEKYGQNIIKFMSFNEKAWDVCRIDGKIWSIPRYARNCVGNVPLIRSDWLEKLNMDMPRTLAEVELFMEKVKETDLNNNNQKDEICMLAAAGTPAYDILVKNFQPYFTGINGSRYLDENNKIVPIFKHPNYKLMLSKFREWYEKGYLYNESFTLKSNQRLDLIRSDRVGIYVGWYTDPTQAMVDLNQTNPDAHLDALPGLKDSPADTPGYGIADAFRPSLYISATSKNPVFAIKYIDWMVSTPENLLFVYHGIEGEHWEWVDKEAKTFHLLDEANRYGGLFWINSGLHLDFFSVEQLFDPSDKLQYLTRKLFVKFSGPEFKGNDEYMLIPTVDGSIHYDFSGTPAESLSNDGATLMAEATINYITGKISIEGWEKSLEKYMEIEGNILSEVLTKQYWNR